MSTYLVMAYNYPFFYASSKSKAEEVAKQLNKDECQGCDDNQEVCIDECEEHCDIVPLELDKEIDV